MNEDQMLGLMKDATTALDEEKLRAHLLHIDLAHAQDENKELKAQVEELLDALEDVVNQACWVERDQLLDSMALSANAHGLRTLAKHNRIEIEHQVGRRVIALWVNHS